MIYTSYYANIKNLPKNMTLVSISGDGGKSANFSGYCYKKLAPKFGFWKQWHDNIDKIDEKENEDFYIREFKFQVLKELRQEDIEKDLHEKFGENIVLLCYEKSSDFCHRHIVSDWFSEVNIKVEEISSHIKTFDIFSSKD